MTNITKEQFLEAVKERAALLSSGDPTKENGELSQVLPDVAYFITTIPNAFSPRLVEELTDNDRLFGFYLRDERGIPLLIGGKEFQVDRDRVHEEHHSVLVHLQR